MSLWIEEITLESLAWVLKSLRKDEMTPTDKLVASRIKECYGIKITNQEWANFMLSLQSMCDKNGLIHFKLFRNDTLQEIAIKIAKCPPEYFAKTKMNEGSQDGSMLITILDGHDWQMNDTKEMSPLYKGQWKIFIQFLKDFFDNETGISITHDSSLDSSRITSQSNDNIKWVRSVESSSNSFLTQPKKKQKKTPIKPPKSITKAIPGGKYGCAQLLKCCGPLPLKICSFGVLCLLIQEAIASGILIYYKTLLIKPNLNISFDFLDYLNLFDDEMQPQQQILEVLQDEKVAQQQQCQQEKIAKIKQVLVEILEDQQKGVTLARIPKLI